MANKALRGIHYTELFPALGKFIQDQELNDVVVMEFEEGIIITGTKIIDAREEYNHSIETHILSAQDLRALLPPPPASPAESERRGRLSELFNMMGGLGETPSSEQ